MGVVIGLGAYSGVKLDEKYPNFAPFFTIVLSLLGIAIGLYLVLKEVIKDSKKK